MKTNSISLSGSRKKETGLESTLKELAGGPIFEKFDFEPGSKAEKNGRKALRQLNKARFAFLARHPCEGKLFTQEKGGKRALVEYHLDVLVTKLANKICRKNLFFVVGTSTLHNARGRPRHKPGDADSTEADPDQVGRMPRKRRPEIKDRKSASSADSAAIGGAFSPSATFGLGGDGDDGTVPGNRMVSGSFSGSMLDWP